MKLLMKSLAALIAVSATGAACAQDAGQAPAPATSTTTTTTTTQTAQPASPKAGDVVYDKAGQSIGTITSVDSSGAVVTTAKGKVSIPLASLGSSTQGLTINMTKAEVEAAITAAPKG